MVNSTSYVPLPLKELLFDQQILIDTRDKVYDDLLSRQLDFLVGVEKVESFRYTNLKCPSLVLQPSGIYVVFISLDVQNDQAYLVFRKRLAETISYQGFWPFATVLSDIPYLSLVCGIELSFEYARQFNFAWKLDRILMKYPELTSQPGFQERFQKFGFEVMGYSPTVWKPPYRIELSTGI